MQAITVKFLGPTKTKGSRYKASAAAGSVTLSTDFALNGQDNAARAAVRLCEKFGWTKPYYGDLVCGGLEDGSYVFVMDGGITERYSLNAAPSDAQPVNA